LGESFDATKLIGVIDRSPGAGRMLYQLKLLYLRVLGALAFALAPGLTDVGLAGITETHRAGQGPYRIAADVPMMAIVSLSRQRVTVYDARGKMLEAPVSTGQSGYETPAGIYSVIQKNRDHYSNLYENAPMPFMQRITWSGIALHGGALPGYPASHGCIRLPHDFARQLFELTKMGMRVVVVRDDMLPVNFTHPALFRPGASSLDQPDAKIENAALAPAMTRRSIAAAKVAAAEAAAERARHARRAASRARQDAAEYLERLEIAEGAKTVADATLKEADAFLQADLSARDGERLRAVKAKAQDRLSAAQAQIDAIYAEGKARIDAAVAARAEAKAAREASALADEEARLAAPAPVSVFISRATQRLYVRQAFEPMFESSVTIRDPDAPIGTTLFTALGYAGKDTDELRWSALAMYSTAYSTPANLRPAPDPARRNAVEPARTDAAAAKAALERIGIPQQALDRINGLVTPGSSLIVSDEEMSRETRKGTDFVVLMSGEPQGAIKRRRLRPYLFSGPRRLSGDSGPRSWW
jgi:hypothetical protein